MHALCRLDDRGTVRPRRSSEARGASEIDPGVEGPQPELDAVDL